MKKHWMRYYIALKVVKILVILVFWDNWSF
jgi:hypothetical protein